jgi:hypothetical protein
MKIRFKEILGRRGKAFVSFFPSFLLSFLPSFNFNMSDNNDEDVPQLSAAALAALSQFYEEEQELKDQFEQIKEAAEEKYDQGMKIFKEDWQLSQFWVKPF